MKRKDGLNVAAVVLLLVIAVAVMVVPVALVKPQLLVVPALLVLVALCGFLAGMAVDRRIVQAVDGVPARHPLPQAFADPVGANTRPR